MKYEVFDKLLDAMFVEEREIGDTKGKEYTQGDRTDNFKRLAKELGLTPKQILWVYLKKHLDSIAHYIRTEAKNPEDLKIFTEPIEARIKDARVYLSLLRALVEEDKGVRC